MDGRKGPALSAFFARRAAIAAPAQNFIRFQSFEFASRDGNVPFAALIQATDGNLYGTTYAGDGTAFKMTPTGTLSLFYAFCSKGGQSCTDGAEPYTAGLIQGTDGNFYGTTSSGGANACSTGGCGTVFKITPGGTLTTL